MTELQLSESLSAKAVAINTDSIHAGEGTRVTVKFENGFAGSVVRGPYTYGGPEGLFELAVLREGQLHYENSIARGDVQGWLHPERVLELLEEISNLNETALREYAKEDELREIDRAHESLRSQIIAHCDTVSDPDMFYLDDDEELPFDVRMALKALTRITEDRKDRIRSGA